MKYLPESALEAILSCVTDFETISEKQQQKQNNNKTPPKTTPQKPQQQTSQ